MTGMQDGAHHGKRGSAVASSRPLEMSAPERKVAKLIIWGGEVASRVEHLDMRNFAYMKAFRYPHRLPQ